MGRTGWIILVLMNGFVKSLLCALLQPSNDLAPEYTPKVVVAGRPMDVLEYAREASKASIKVPSESKSKRLLIDTG